MTKDAEDYFKVIRTNLIRASTTTRKGDYIELLDAVIEEATARRNARANDDD